MLSPFQEVFDSLVEDPQDEIQARLEAKRQESCGAQGSKRRPFLAVLSLSKASPRLALQLLGSTSLCIVS